MPSIKFEVSISTTKSETLGSNFDKTEVFGNDTSHHNITIEGWKKVLVRSQITRSLTCTPVSEDKLILEVRIIQVIE